MVHAGREALKNKMATAAAHQSTQLSYSGAFYYYVRRTTVHQVFFYALRPLWPHFVTWSFPSYLSLFTSWVQGTSRRLLASITIVDYSGTIGVAFIYCRCFFSPYTTVPSARHIR